MLQLNINKLNIAHGDENAIPKQLAQGKENILPLKVKEPSPPKFKSLIRNSIKQTSAIPRFKQNPQIEDIDKSTSRDAIFLVSDLAKDIYDYMFTLEEQQAIKTDYLKDQKIFTPKVRQRLINWCMEIHSQLRLLPETLYMTIAVIDRFFDRVQVKHQSQVQLVAVGATLIASKYEEIYPPEVADLMHLTQNAYTRREIMRAEINILEQLEFNLGKPIPLAFLRRFSKAAHCDTKMHSMAKYLMELSLSEYECCHWKPSFLAAAALFATVHLVHHDTTGSTTIRRLAPLASISQNQQQQPDRWTRSLEHYTHYSRQDLQEPAARLCKILKRSQKSPQSFYCAKKSVSNLSKWPEFKSIRVDKVIEMGEQRQR